MIVHCPRCKAPIGEGADSCPECYLVFSEADKRAIVEEKRSRVSSEYRDQQEMLDAFYKKRRVFLRALIIALIMIPGVPAVVLATGANLTVLVVAYVITVLFMIGTIVAGIVTGAARCPYCDSILFRQYGTHCHTCGKKIF